MKAIRIDDSGSVLIDTGKGFNVWMDVYNDGSELTTDWNQYIFILTDENDLKIRDFQNDCNNYDICNSLAIEYYEQNFKV